MDRALSILHIDDDADTRLLLRELLKEAERARGRQLEIHWLEAAGVEEAVARFQAAPLDAILLDNRLGPHSGAELLPRVRRIWNCPVWILTGLCTDTLRAQSRELGAAGVIGKDEVLHSGTDLRSFLVDRCRSSEDLPIDRAESCSGIS